MSYWLVRDRLCLLLHCGVVWHTQPTTRIRGRLPRLDA